jgi:hypothetical protein
MFPSIGLLRHRRQQSKPEKQIRFSPQFHMMIFLAAAFKPASTQCNR